jgi:two-component system OmpR family response regulator
MMTIEPNHFSYAQGARIVILDHDPQTRLLLRKHLKEHGYNPAVAAGCPELRRAVTQGEVDLVVLGVAPANSASLELCRELRAKSQVPIVILSARTELTDRIAAFDAGADDYVRRPFDPPKFIGRINAILRRTNRTSHECEQPCSHLYRFSSWEFDALARELKHRDGSIVTLSSTQSRLLTLLLKHSGRVVSRSQLMSVFAESDPRPSDRLADTYVSRLRRKLCDNARSPQIIKGVYGEGYVLAVRVEPIHKPSSRNCPLAQSK